MSASQAQRFVEWVGDGLDEETHPALSKYKDAMQTHKAVEKKHGPAPMDAEGKHKRWSSNLATTQAQKYSKQAKKRGSKSNHYDAMEQHILAAHTARHAQVHFKDTHHSLSKAYKHLASYHDDRARHHFTQSHEAKHPWE